MVSANKAILVVSLVIGLSLPPTASAGEWLEFPLLGFRMSVSDSWEFEAVGPHYRDLIEANRDVLQQRAKVVEEHTSLIFVAKHTSVNKDESMLTCAVVGDVTVDMASLTAARKDEVLQSAMESGHSETKKLATADSDIKYHDTNGLRAATYTYTMDGKRMLTRAFIATDFVVCMAGGPPQLNEEAEAVISSIEAL